MNERRLNAKVHKLKKAAAKAPSIHVADVKKLRKVAQGGYNRILEKQRVMTHRYLCVFHAR
jgi:methylthioribose-1-phosphate isomerase